MNSVILPTARFADKSGKKKKKATIKEAQESFILFLRNINDVEIEIGKRIEKLYASQQNLFFILLIKTLFTNFECILGHPTNFYHSFN